jgi:hypothetical protein
MREIEKGQKFKGIKKPGVETPGDSKTNCLARVIDNFSPS